MFRGTDRRRRQKRRGGDEKNTPAAAPVQAPGFEVELCELVDVGGGDALLRAAGRWSPAPPERIDLVSFANGAIERIEPLPPGAGVAADGLWHVAFCVAETVTSAHLALMTPTGVAVGLPAPTRLLPAPAGPSAHDEELAAERSARAEAEERLEHALEDLSDAQALVDQFRRRCELSERSLTDFRDKLVTAWGEAASMRDLLDEREAAHAAAKERARAADEVVAEVEARARRSRRELATRRDELEHQCARLQAELAERAASDLSVAQKLAAGEALRAEAADALTRFEAARADAAALELQLTEAQQLADEATAATARAAQEILAERQKTDEAAHQADVYSERLAKAERELREAREELEKAHAQAAEAGGLVEALEAESVRADEATSRAQDAQRQLTEARDELAQINQHVEALEANFSESSASTAEALAEERARAEEATRQVEVHGERLAKAERELREAREELAQAHALAGQSDALAAALEAESARADAATRRVEDANRDLAAAHDELLRINQRIQSIEADAAAANAANAEALGIERARAQEASARTEVAERELAATRDELAAEKARADEAARRTAETEWQLAEARERLVAAESATSNHPTPAQAAVETDLRHLLEKRQQELDEARAELAEQRSRYAAVASEVPPAEEPPAKANGPEKAEPWSRVDEDLLERLARAKSLAGGQD